MTKRFRGHVWMALFAGLSWMSATPAQSAPEVTRIEIDSRWGGLNPDSPFGTQLVIEKDGAGYRLSGNRSQGRGERHVKTVIPERTVSADQVARLAAALRAPVRSTLDPELLQPAAAQLQRHLDGLLPDIAPPSSPVAAKVRAWRETFREPSALAAAATRGIVRHWHTDDYPGIRIRATFADGSKQQWSSRSQSYLMLPWKNADDEPTYAVELPLSVGAVLPEESTNKERLEDKHLRDDEWADLLDGGLAADIGRFRTEARMPDAFAVLSKRFDVDEMDPVDWQGPQLDVDMRLPDSPKNLTLSERLDIRGRALAHAADADRMAQQLTLAQSSPALLSRMNDHPNVPFRISHRGWSRLNRATAAQFQTQMASLGKLPELKRDPSLLRDAVMVEEGDVPVYWIVLADRRAVRWKEYASKDEPGTRCEGIPMGEDAHTYGKTDICYGTIFDADGKVQ